MRWWNCKKKATREPKHVPTFPSAFEIMMEMNKAQERKMIPASYCKVDGKYIGYCYFNNQHIFSSGRNLTNLTYNLRMQVYSKFRIKPLASNPFNFAEVSRDEIPFDRMEARTYNKFFAQKRSSSHTFGGVSETLPTFIPSTPDAKDDTYSHVVKDRVLYVYKLVAKYKLA